MDIRAFDGTLCDARAMIDIDRETFDMSHYTPEYILALQADPRQRAWLAVENGRAAGFVSAFDTHSLSADRWEIDELAVRPAFQGRGYATRLIAQATGDRMERPKLTHARALVALGNLASQRAFARNDFAPIRDVHLLLYEVSGRVPRPRTAGAPTVQEMREIDMPAIAKLARCTVARVSEIMRWPENMVLVAIRGGTPVGYVEMIHVRTLQYSGFWIESLSVAGRDRRTAKALFGEAIEEAKRRPAIDQVGYLASPEDGTLYTACVSEGFRRVGEYRTYVHGLHP